MPHTRKRSFYSKPSSLSNKFFFDISSATIWKDGLKSRFSKRFLQRVRFWIEKNTTRYIFDWKKYNALDFEFKVFRLVRFWDNVCIQKITFVFILLRENDIFCIFCAFSKSIILYWKILYASDFELKRKYNASDFEVEKTQRDRFWKKSFFRLVRFSIKNLTTCQIFI